jgi:hypothetical protein
MSPEQVKGLGSDVRSDVFSLGVLFFEMATGERPFDGETVATLKAKLVADDGPKTAPRPARGQRHQPRPEAYELLLKARFFYASETREGIDAARDTIERAIELDPEFALAYALLASCYTGSFAYGLIGADEAEAGAVPASRRALELDDGLPDAHRVEGSIDCYLRWDFAAAEAKTRRAIELEPGGARGYRSLAMNALAPQGRLEERFQGQPVAQQPSPGSAVEGVAPTHGRRRRGAA